MSRFRFALAILLIVAAPLHAQRRPLVLAFPKSAGIGIGVASFNTRSTANRSDFSYKGSLVVSGKYDMPITRRTGVVLSAGLAPLSQQRDQSELSTLLSEKLLVTLVDAAVGFRFKPSAPVFFAAGAGATIATRPPMPESTGAVVEPHALVAVGYDAKTTETWNIRSVLNNRLVFVAADDQDRSIEESMAFDWSVEIVFRYTFPGAPAR